MEWELKDLMMVLSLLEILKMGSWKDLEHSKIKKEKNIQGFLRMDNLTVKEYLDVKMEVIILDNKWNERRG